ncbi:MAG: DUF167 domain-containing protein [Acidimicrobiales bacterium]
MGGSSRTGHRADSSRTVRVTVRVQPRARRTKVGGRYGDAEPPVLVARVAAPAVDGRANQALVAALADALGVKRSAVRIVAGASGRTKVLEVAGVDPSGVERLLVL